MSFKKMVVMEKNIINKEISIGDQIETDYSDGELYTIKDFTVDIRGYDEFLCIIEDGTTVRPSDIIRVEKKLLKK